MSQSRKVAPTDQKSQTLFAISSVLVVAGIIFLVLFMVKEELGNWTLWTGLICVIAANMVRLYRQKRDRANLMNSGRKKRR